MPTNRVYVNIHLHESSVREPFFYESATFSYGALTINETATLFFEGESGAQAARALSTALSNIADRLSQAKPVAAD